ncbi:hypothetical protein M404DRAFT_1002924 [Pisolithus tinctorius Marx 270]|uniref:Uncharacterized protein n=1 Tax=Pisolithus tinctorius Marx 270 TaxID=870435 RepID=A0A0C3P2G5_PISTI|nr:hypothetical protein M404DRAFT_1002924 [Pisolithus tinctorius Marx 270]
MRPENARRQVLNISRTQMLVAKVPDSSSCKSTKEAINDAMGDWDANLATTYFLIQAYIINLHT